MKDKTPKVVPKLYQINIYKWKLSEANLPYKRDGERGARPQDNTSLACRGGP